MKENESPGRNNMFEGDLDAKEQRDHELIKEHLNEAPGYIENDSWNERTKNSSGMIASGENKRESNSWQTPDGEKRNIWQME